MSSGGMITNANAVTWQGIGGNPVSYTLDVERGSKPAPTPKGLLVTRAVETRDGWLGQLIIDEQIVRETEPMLDAELAMVQINALVVERIKGLFA